MDITAGVTVECREPFLTTDDMGRTFLVEEYWHTTNVYRVIDQYRWVVRGIRVNQDGTQHRGGVVTSKYIPASEVPDYVKDQAAKEYQGRSLRASTILAAQIQHVVA